MTSSPDLIHELRASRPSAPLELRARVREIAAAQPKPAPWASWRFPVRRGVLVAVPAAVALAFASAGVIGLASSDAPSTEALRQSGAADAPATTEAGKQVAPAQDTTALSAGDRAQRVSATLTVEVSDSDAVSRAAQDALELTRSLGGFVVSSSVATGEEGSASITVRVPVAKVQDAITGLSGLGRIVSQQLTIDDLQATLDELEKREATVRSEIARIRARLESETLDAGTEAVLRAKLSTLRAELTELRTGISSTEAEARMSTIQLTVVTPGAFGAVAPPSRIDRTVDEALNVLAWEGVIALGILI
ncbi:MAG TPA: DUF4349 domain-containing protein, partial [Gaiellaceae bacterium]|nr:DUF4349 domain-containing protein [Gaiellaceae bacterium]